MADMRTRSSGDVYGDVASRIREGQRDNNRGVWHRRVEAVAQSASRTASIHQVCEAPSGGTRFLFTAIEMSKLATVQRMLGVFLSGGIGVHGFVTATEPETKPGTLARGRVDTFHVDIHPEADALWAKRAERNRVTCALPVAVLIVAGLLAGWATQQLVNHYAGYHEPFAHQVDAIQTAWAAFT